VISLLSENLVDLFLEQFIRCEWTLTFTHQILTYKTVSLTEVKQGVLPEGGRMVAVKRLAENAPIPSAITFETEVTNLMSLKHDNIVELIHYCHERVKKAVQHNRRYVIVDVIESCLCYRYLPKGSLDNYLYGTLSNTHT
jgi:hypothetical protein